MAAKFRPEMRRILNFKNHEAGQKFKNVLDQACCLLQSKLKNEMQSSVLSV